MTNIYRLMPEGGSKTLTQLGASNNYAEAVVQYDASGNVVPSGSALIGGSISASGASNGVILKTNGASAIVGVVTGGTWTGTLVFDGSPDGGTTWESLPFTKGDGTTIVVYSATTNGNFFVPCYGYNQVRISASALSAGGPITVSMQGSPNYTPFATGANDANGGTGNGLLGSGIVAFDGTNWNRLGANGTYRRLWVCQQGLYTTLADGVRNDGVHQDFHVPGDDGNPIYHPTFPYLYSGSVWNLQREANGAQNTTGTGLAGVGALLFDGTNWQKPKCAYSGTGAVSNSGVPLVQLMLSSSSGNCQGAATAGSLGDNIAGGSLLAAASWVKNASGNYDRMAGNDVAPTTSKRLATAIGAGAITCQNAVTSTGNGTAANLGTAHKDWAVYVHLTGGPATISLQPQVSVDGTNWFNLGSAITSTSDSQTIVLGVPATQVRVQLNTLTGGTSPTVTALVAAM